MDRERGKEIRILVIGCAVALLIALFSRSILKKRVSENSAANSSRLVLQQTSANNAELNHRRSTSNPSAASTPEETVAAMVNQFGRSRREIALKMGGRAGATPPPEVEKFFGAVEAGNWPEIERLWTLLAKWSGQYDVSDPHPEINPFWPAILDAYGVAEQAHLWPPQKLLDYGNAILDSLKPGMVYVGGTDPGRWIPELINESSGQQPHIIVTQNAFADSRYLEFMQEVYGDRMATLTEADSKKAFDEYAEGARKRLEHDQQFPNEPKQVPPGEKIKIVDGKVELSGQPAVMGINERLFQALLEKNPEMSFGIEHSFPFKSTYESSMPLGPIVEVRAEEGAQAMTQERATQAVDYWRDQAQQLLGEDGLKDEKLRQAYAKLAANQAGLFLNRNLAAEAEQTFRFASEIAHSSPEALYGLVNLFTEQKRFNEAVQAVEKSVAANPGNDTFKRLLEQTRAAKSK